jgi:hypothetical protein
MNAMFSPAAGGAAVMPAKLVVIFHAGRSGSRVLGDVLRQHSRIAWEGEIYRKARWCREGPQRWGGPEDWPFDAENLLHTRLRFQTKEFYGFEVKFRHMRAIGLAPAEYFTLLDRLGCRHFMVLKRHNLLRKVISNQVMAVTEATHVKRSPDSPTRVRLDPQCLKFDGTTSSLIGHLDRLDAYFATLDPLLENRPALRLTYEDDIRQDPRVAAEKVCAFLGVDREPLDVHLARTNPFPIREMIENYDEVHRCLQGTRFEWMLEEPGGPGKPAS